jgi:hypothetical protein
MYDSAELSAEICQGKEKNKITKIINANKFNIHFLKFRN